MQVLQIFLTIKTPCSEDTLQPIQFLFTVLTFKVIQGEWFSCHLKANMQPPISDQ